MMDFELCRSHVSFDYFHIKLDILQLHFGANHFINVGFFSLFFWYSRGEFLWHFATAAHITNPTVNKIRVIFNCMWIILLLVFFNFSSKSCLSFWLLGSDTTYLPSVFIYRDNDLCWFSTSTHAQRAWSALIINSQNVKRQLFQDFAHSFSRIQYFYSGWFSFCDKQTAISHVKC